MNPQQSQYQQYQQPPQYGPPQYQPAQYYGKEKEGVLALVLSLIVPGLGQIYCGKILRGLMILILLPIAYIGIMMLVVFGAMGGGMMNGNDSVFYFSGIMLVVWIVGLIIWIWQIVDAYRLAERYNEELRRTGRPPW